MPKNAENSQAVAISLKGLNDALALLKQANLIIDKVQSGWVVPDAPEQPPAIEVLTGIKAQATHAVGIASRLLRMGGA